jgi:hypothetical protein
MDQKQTGASMTSESKGVSPEARAVRRYTILPWTEDGVSRMVAEEDYDALARRLDIEQQLTGTLNEELEELRKELAKVGVELASAMCRASDRAEERDQARSTLWKLASELQRTHPSILRMRGIVDAVTDTRERK